MKWQDVGEKLHNEEHHNLCSSPSIIRTIKSGRMRYAGHVALMGRGEYRYVSNLKAKREETTRKFKT
jgi:hypothetical protein